MRRTLSRPAPTLRSEAALLQRGTRAAPPLVAPRFSHNFSSVPIRAKLKVGAAGDAFEREADRVADQVMKTPESRVQRACECGGSCGDCSSPDDEPAPVRRKSLSNENVASDGFEHIVRGGGAPLDGATRAFMEPRFGYDFALVRVHTGVAAAESAASLKARAYTVGRDIVFGGGEYRPHTAEGRSLLAHELTHVTQQSDGNDSRVQRKMTLTNPTALAPSEQIQDFMLPPPPRAVVLQSWLDELCGGGKFIVNPSTGVVTNAAQDSFCRATKKTGCQCLCTATSPDSKDIEIQIDDTITLLSSTASSEIKMIRREDDLADTGGGGTYPAEKSAVVGMRGTIAELEGVGDTSPQKPGTGSHDQVLRTPDWLTFGHELCGHALLQKGDSDTGHLVTREGNRSATDVENQLRREHSTVTDSLGIRHGVFNGQNEEGEPIQRDGAALRVEAGDTLAGIAARVGIPATSMLDQIWRFDGTRITEETKDTIAAGEEVLIERISWHTVIEDETMYSIAEMWNVPLDSLLRANPQIAAPESAALPPGTRLLIPVR
jgi:hypothetical protein